MIALYRGKSWLSKAIRWQTRSPYSHAAWLLEDGSVIEAWQRGGVGYHASLGTVHTAGTPVDLFDIDWPGGGKSQQEFAELWLRKQIGKAYDFGSVLRFLSRKHQDTAAREKWFCSELLFEAVASTGLRLLERTEAWEVSPGLLARSPLLRFIGSTKTEG